jgi:hypothetical protein
MSSELDEDDSSVFGVVVVAVSVEFGVFVLVVAGLI